ncbi:MAG: hypothetical protein LBC73_01330 [Oscillospiraceae bacterium]|jgi:hypothetical protein|nr:hypothetical protein [Oscillospiraceae bacterium]
MYWSIGFHILALLMFGLAGVIVNIYLRVIVRTHAFNGLSNSRRKKILNNQSLLNKILMTYAMSGNRTKYYYQLGTWWSLVCYYILLACFFIVMIFLTTMIFVEVNEVLFNLVVKVGGISIALSVASIFLPGKLKKR